MKRHRGKHTAEFKSRVAIEALRGTKTMSEIAAEFETHRNDQQLEKEMLEHLPKLFENKNAGRDKDSDGVKERLHSKVGQLMMEIGFLEKKCRQFGIPVKGRNSLGGVSICRISPHVQITPEAINSKQTGRERVRHLLRLMGLEAIYPGKREAAPGYRTTSLKLCINKGTNITSQC